MIASLVSILLTQVLGDDRFHLLRSIHLSPIGEEVEYSTSNDGSPSAKKQRTGYIVGMHNIIEYNRM